ncbi:MAG: S41 family peptidase [Proteobacteria bacterium]|nr:S41 family peptidase [Pseudomonadota bacterium]MCP4921918.1 S41 family peptidase [Pseudomonadota bacterium]
MIGKVLKNPSVRAFVATFIVFTIGLVGGNYTVVRAAEVARGPYESLDTFARALTQIETQYVDEVDTSTLVWAAIDGMADALDPRTQFFDPDTYQALMEDTEGATSGVGVLVNAADAGGLLVVEVVAGGPAELGGVLVGDRIVAVDGADVQTWSVEQAISAVKGPRGTEVVLTVVRDDPDAPQTLSIVRDEVHQSSVTGAIVEPGIGYIRIDQFRRRSADEFLAELGRLESLDGGSLDALVIDLRNNPGGLLEQAVTIVDHFVADGLIVEARYRTESLDERHEATVVGSDTDTRLVVLIDGMSASASEIVAGSLQDHERAELVGVPSYGKGSVQTYFEYEDESALSLTIGKYYLPSGRHLERGDGIVPEHEVVLPGPLTPSEELRERLATATLPESERAELLDLAARIPAATPQPGVPTFRGSVRDRVESDPQLSRAFEVAKQ